MTDVTQQLIEASNAPLGGLALLQPGNFDIASPLNILSRTAIRGAGPGITILKAGTINGSIWAARDASDICIENLTLDCRNQTAGHGLRFENCKNVRLHNLVILGASHYGIGFQSSQGVTGTTLGLHISNCWIVDPGGDGIDLKNVGSANDVMFLSNIYVEDPQGAGLDIRGPAQVQGIRVTGLKPGGRGIRFRPGSNEWGAGARNSSLTGFYCSSESSTTRGDVGVEIVDSYVSVSAGKVDNCHNGVHIAGGSHSRVGQVIAEGCTHGFRTTNSNFNQFTGCAGVQCQAIHTLTGTGNTFWP